MKKGWTQRERSTILTITVYRTRKKTRTNLDVKRQETKTKKTILTLRDLKTGNHLDVNVRKERFYINTI